MHQSQTSSAARYEVRTLECERKPDETKLELSTDDRARALGCATTLANSRRNATVIMETYNAATGHLVAGRRICATA